MAPVGARVVAFTIAFLLVSIQGASVSSSGTDEGGAGASCTGCTADVCLSVACALQHYTNITIDAGVYGGVDNCVLTIPEVTLRGATGTASDVLFDCSGVPTCGITFSPGVTSATVVSDLTFSRCAQVSVDSAVVRLPNVAPVFSNVVFSHHLKNSTSDSDASVYPVVYASGSAEPTFVDCVFTDNVVLYHRPDLSGSTVGSIMYVTCPLTLRRVTIVDNVVENGAAVAGTFQGIIHVNGGALTMEDSDITNNIAILGYVNAQGHVIYSRSNSILSIFRTTVRSNYMESSFRGSGIYATTGSLTVYDCDFENNVVNMSFVSNSNGYGSALRVNQAFLNLSHTRFIGNELYGYVAQATVYLQGTDETESRTIEHCEFRNNYNEGRSVVGALLINAGAVTVRDTNFTSNTVRGVRISGTGGNPNGVLYRLEPSGSGFAPFYMRNCIFSDNTVRADSGPSGGAFYFLRGNVFLTNVVVTGTRVEATASTTARAAFAYINSANVTLDGVDVYDNSVSTGGTAQGGVAYLTKGENIASMYASNTRFEGNYLSGANTYGGGVYVGPECELHMSSTSILNHVASRQGGAIYANSDTTIMLTADMNGPVILSDNTSPEGSAVWMRSGSGRLLCDQCEMRNNAGTMAAVMCFVSGRHELRSVVMCDNLAPNTDYKCDYTGTSNATVRKECGGPPTCTDTIQNGAENGPDCGNLADPQCSRCDGNYPCEDDNECLSYVCNASLCTFSTCTDGIFNGYESDVDCGFGLPNCDFCQVGQMCTRPKECATLNCEGGRCAERPPACHDRVQNGDETDVDCGGYTCAQCRAGKACVRKADCLSNQCEGGICQGGPTCNDGVHNQNEADVDCAGECPPCQVGGTCRNDLDCTTQNCSAGVCAVNVSLLEDYPESYCVRWSIPSACHFLTIVPLPTDETAEGFYQYATPFAASMNAGLEESGTSQTFLLKDSVDPSSPDGDYQISLTTVHDKPEDGDGGRIELTFRLSSSLRDFPHDYIVKDDPGEFYEWNQTKSLEGRSIWAWLDCCTDGQSFGPVVKPAQLSAFKYFYRYINLTAGYDNDDEPVIRGGLQATIRTLIEDGSTVTQNIPWRGGFYDDFTVEPGPCPSRPSCDLACPECELSSECVWCGSGYGQPGRCVDKVCNDCNAEAYDAVCPIDEYCASLDECRSCTVESLCSWCNSTQTCVASYKLDYNISSCPSDAVFTSLSQCPRPPVPPPVVNVTVNITNGTIVPTVINFAEPDSDMDTILGVVLSFVLLCMIIACVLVARKAMRFQEDLEAEIDVFLNQNRVSENKLYAGNVQEGVNPLFQG